MKNFVSHAFFRQFSIGAFRARLLLEFSRMTTAAKADKSRLTIRGLVDGQYYIVREQPAGWFIAPEKTHRVEKKPA
jgi:hypothetical protein